MQNQDTITRRLNHVRPVRRITHAPAPRLGIFGILSDLAAVIIHYAKPSSPRVQQRIWFLVLLEGLLFFPISISLPWYQAQPLPIADQHVRSESITVAASPSSLPAISLPINGSEKASLGQVVISPSHEAPAIIAKSSPRRLELALADNHLGFMAHGNVDRGDFGVHGFFAEFQNLSPQASIRKRSWSMQWIQLLSEHRIRRPIPLRVTVNFGPALCLLPSGLGCWCPSRFGCHSRIRSAV